MTSSRRPIIACTATPSILSAPAYTTAASVSPELWSTRMASLLEAVLPDRPELHDNAGELDDEYDLQDECGMSELYEMYARD